ncbi:MAG: cell division protein FtsZ, partial [Candidatus Amulumruptor sp.]|nr:cell division protein FtsZ [Candidatus Amulumruptor sp.]
MDEKDYNIDGLAQQIAPDSDKTYHNNCKIKVIGVGGGGNNAVNHMYLQDIKNVSFVVCNTDRQALRVSPVPVKVQIGDGLGAGNKPEKARDAAERDIDKIRELFDEDTKMVFVTAGMGGGTGTGAAPIVAREAKELGILTVGIVTIPFLFEGERKILKALDGVDEMAKHVDALLVINNERLTEIYGDLDFMNAFGKAADTLSTAASSISELITKDGYMNLDFEDVDTTLRDGGAAIISSGYGEGDGRVTLAIKDALNSPLLKNRDIFTSKRLLFHIYYSRTAQNSFKMSEAQEITDFVSGINPDVDVIWGLAFDDTLGEKVRITILAAGFEVTIREEETNEMAAARPGGRGPIRWGNASGSRQAAPAPQTSASRPADKIAEE